MATKQVHNPNRLGPCFTIIATDKAGKKTCLVACMDSRDARLFLKSYNPVAKSFGVRAERRPIELRSLSGDF